MKHVETVITIFPEEIRYVSKRVIMFAETPTTERVSYRRRGNWLRECD